MPLKGDRLTHLFRHIRKSNSFKQNAKYGIQCKVYSCDAESSVFWGYCLGPRCADRFGRAGSGRHSGCDVHRRLSSDAATIAPRLSAMVLLSRSRKAAPVTCLLQLGFTIQVIPIPVVLVLVHVLGTTALVTGPGRCHGRGSCINAPRSRLARDRWRCRERAALGRRRERTRG